MSERRLLLACQSKVGSLMEAFAKADASDVQDFVTTIQMITVVINKLLARTGRTKKPLQVDMRLIEHVLELLEEYDRRLLELIEAGGISKLLQQNRRRKRVEEVSSQLYEAVMKLVEALRNEAAAPKISRPKGSGAPASTASDASGPISPRASQPTQSQLTASPAPSSASPNASPGMPRAAALARTAHEKSDSDSAGSLVVPAMDPYFVPAAQMTHNPPPSHPPTPPANSAQPPSAVATPQSTPPVPFPLTKKFSSMIVESELDSESSHLAGMANQLIASPEGASLWRSAFGEMTFQVSFDVFLRHYATMQPELSSADVEDLRSVLETGGNVNMYKFSEFLKAFGPLRKSLSNLRHIMRAPWFHEYLTSVEAELFLHSQPPGSYLLRFSRSRNGSFALAFKLPTGMVLHVLIRGVLPEGFSLEENQQTRYFPDIDSVLQYYTSYLVHPFTSRLNKQRWFHGELSTAEATRMLAGRPRGTFLVRFSSVRGSYAVSYVAEDGSVIHALASAASDGRFHFNNHPDMFNTIPELVDRYRNMLIIPYTEN